MACSKDLHQVVEYVIACNGTATYEDLYYIFSDTSRNEINWAVSNAIESGTIKGSDVQHQSRFSDIVKRLGETVESKNKAYGDSFGKSADFMKILYPDGIKPEDYWKFLILTRMFDKMMRLATNNDPMREDPFLDIAGYAVLGMKINGRKP